MQPEVELDPEEVQAARRQVSRAMGRGLGEKGSDRFCVAAFRRMSGRGPTAGLEAAVGSPAPVAAVVEFAGDASVPSLPRLTESEEWPSLSKSLESLGAMTPRGASLRVPAVLRQAVIAAVRNDCYRTISPVYDEIERLSGSTLRQSTEVLGAPQISTLVNQVCWLNRTVRTWAGPEVLADVAADDNVVGVDVPRRLMPDADTINHQTIGLPDFVRATGLTGDGITVAVIDSEAALGHPALSGRLVHRRNYTPEPWGNPDSHGTAVAGIVAADDPVNGGIAPGAIIYNYKVIATNRFLNGDDFGGALAIQQALEDGVDIANCSWGAGAVRTELSREARAVNAAWELGLTVVKSAGNQGPDASTMTTPAEAAGIIVVGACDLAGTRVESYSSRGPALSKKGPDVVAPGGGPDGALACCLVTGGFGDAGVGTSYAAPHVSGLLALFLQREPHLIPDQLRERLRNDAQSLAGDDVSAQGAGLIRAI
jgi:serine protease AprX